MEVLSRQLKILVLARNADTESNRFTLTQLRKISQSNKLKITCLTNTPLSRISGLSVDYLGPENVFRRFDDPALKKIDLIIVVDMGEEDVDLIISALRHPVLILAEQKMINQFPEYLIAGKTVISYSRLNTFQLAMAIMEILRNFIYQRNFLNEAQRIALSWQYPSGRGKNVQEGSKERGRGQVIPAPNSSPDSAPATKAESNPRKSTASIVIKPEDVVDIVIISYNTLAYLTDCIDSIRENTGYPYRLIVVDNGSTDGSLKYLQGLKNITLLENKANLGYARACNMGIGAGKGEFVVLLNSDIKVLTGWLSTMVETAKSHPNIGVIGPKMINEKGQIVGAGVMQLDSCCPPRGWLVQDKKGVFDQQEDCYSVGGACYLTRRTAIESVGAFDENYFFYFEEADLSLRMLEKGYRVVYCPEAKVIHFHEGSLNKSDPEDRSNRNCYFEQSQQRFLKKWSAVLQHQSRRGKPRDIVAFGIIPWDFRFQRPQQMLSRLAKAGYRVLYINNFCVRDGNLRQVTENIYAFSPDGEGLVYQALKSPTKTRRIINSLYDTLAKLDIINPLFWVDVPYWQSILLYFDRQYLVYNCMDSYSDFSDIQEFCPNISRSEEKLASSADFIVTSSQILQEKLARFNPATYVIPNGVDLQHFSLEQDLVTPPELSKIEGPIIGYFGAIADWLDLDLMHYLAKKLPQFSFVYIGNSTVDLDRFNDLANVHFLGEKSYFDLPNYAQHFQVAIIPFQKNQLTLSTNPVKLYEYLASGLPVVTVDLPEVRQFKDVVYIAKDYAEFALYVGEVAHWESDEMREKRIKAVEAEDWEMRVSQVLELLAQRESTLEFQSRFPQLPEHRKIRSGKDE